MTSLFLSIPAITYAASSPTSSTTAISQSYLTSSSSIIQGELVSLVTTGSNVVVPATPGNAVSLVGIAADKPVLELSNTGKSSIQVATSGSMTVLVSDANGPVKAGDKITASPIAGIGMRAIGSGEIVGTAQKSLSSITTVTEEATGTNGQRLTYHVGLLPIAINVVYYSAVSSSGSVSAYVPPFLQNLANSVVGKSVSPVRVLIATVALLLGFFAVIVMLYAAIRSSVISLGRNPLAEDALRRGMADIIIGAVAVLIITGTLVAAVVFV